MYSYENYDLVKAEIENRRQKAISQADARNLELRARSSEIAEIDRELSGTGLLIFKTACSGGDITPIKDRNEALNKRRREIIKSLGLPEDYTDVQYFCRKCSDTGFIGGSKMCSCMRELLVIKNIAASGMGKLIEKQSFDNFSLELYKTDSDLYERMKYNVDTARKFAENFSSEGGNLLLVGGTGTGKTHLSSAIAREVITRGFDVLYDSTQNIIGEFEADKFKSGYGPYEPKSTKYMECDLLILDDLGTEFTNQFTVSCLYNLLNTRLNRGLSTIISTNLGAEELASRYEDRIYSRIIGRDSTILFFGGSDQRLA
jgi:DNA replication protein DnaC